jgi:hypothetical protein
VQADARAQALRTARVVVNLVCAIAFALALLVPAILSWANIPHIELNAGLVIVAYGATATSVWLFFKIILESEPTQRGTVTLARVSIAGLAILTPLAVILSFRLGFEMCAVLNLLGLPWPSDVKFVVRLICDVIIVLYIALLVVGFRRPSLKRAAVIAVIYSGVMAIPTLLVLFLTVYGDPGPNCIRG